jgi:hypothetical protein
MKGATKTPPKAGWVGGLDVRVGVGGFMTERTHLALWA